LNPDEGLLKGLLVVVAGGAPKLKLNWLPVEAAAGLVGSRTGLISIPLGGGFPMKLGIVGAVVEVGAAPKVKGVDPLEVALG
jgi:hypothetical protein